jgi:hypothetical protein
MNTLEDRIHACVPVTGQAFAKLMSLMSVEESRDIDTASVTTGSRSRLLVNPDFVAEHCRSDDHLAMLVLHELYHVLLGHTRLYRRVTPAQNWAFDCLINAQLCRLFPHPRHTSFFARFVADASGPALLLGPPEGWQPMAPGNGAQQSSPPRLAPPDFAQENGAADRYGEGARALRLRDAHWRLYAEESVTTEELYELLERIEVTDGELAGLPLLGDHGDRSDRGDGHDAQDDDPATPLHPEVLREVRDIVARWPMVTERSGRDQGASLHEQRVSRVERNRQAAAVLRRALAWAANAGGAPGGWRRDEADTPALLPFDSGRDRRGAVQRLLGAEPLLWAGETRATGRAPADRVRVYLDVSGSMEGAIAPLYAALAGSLDLVEPRIHGFSTEIAPLTHAQLRAGLRLTTGGTEIEAVTAHLLGHGAKGSPNARPPRRALIVTDGWVGAIPDAHCQALARRRVRVAAVLTHDGDASFARAIGAPVFRLPPL